MHKFITHPAVRLLVIVLVTVSFWRAAGPTWAAESLTFTPELDIPGEFSGPQDVDNNLFGRYVRAIYIYFIWIVGIVATFMIVFAGVKWVAAAGNPAAINDARDMMNNAIIGVIIGLTSVVLLNLLSPRFTSLSIPGTTSVSSKYYEGAFVTRICNPASDGTKEELTCGHVKKIGSNTKEDKNGVKQDEYCMGVICDRAEICQISKNAVSGYYGLGGGCVKDITIGNQTGEYQSIPSLPVYSDRVLGPKCNQIDPGYIRSAAFGGLPYRTIGFFCSSWGNDSACYMVGNKATIIDNPPGVTDTVNNMACAPTNL